MKAAFALLLLAASPASAFLFGGGGNGRAAARLEELRRASAAGDCAAVEEASRGLFSEKPGPAAREEAYAVLGDCYERGGAEDKAVGNYKLALELFPESALFARRLAALYNRAGFHADAVPPLRRVLERTPGDAAAAQELARAYAAMGFLGRAAELYASLAPPGSGAAPALLREYLQCLLGLRDWQNAGALAARGAAAEPGEHFWPLAAARALAGQGRYSEAAEKAAEAEALSKSPQRRLERALYLLLAGRGAEAAAAAEAELRAGPSQLASFIKGLALYSAGDYAGSEPFFREAGGENFTGRLAGAFLRGTAGEEPCAK